jgi:putative peptidoglycan lipid II flippase
VSVRVVRLAALSALAKGPGFLIPIVVAAFFGAAQSTDAYFLAYAGVLVAGGAFGQPIEAAVVPFAAKALARGRRSADLLMQSLLYRVIGVGVFAGIVGGLLLTVGMLSVGSIHVPYGRTVVFYALLMPTVVAWCVAALYSGSLASAWRLERAAIAYGFRGMGALIGAVVGAAFHQLWSVAIGMSVGEIARAWWLRGSWSDAISQIPDGIDHEAPTGFFVAAASQVGAQGVLSVVQFVERLLVGTVAVAAISRVEYANRLIMVAAVIFDGGIAPWLLARWSNVGATGGQVSGWRLVYRPILFAAALAVLVGAALSVSAPFAVRLLLQHGAFTSEDSSVVATLLRLYAVGYVFNMVSLCIERLLLARIQNRLFFVLASVRASIRILVVIVALSTYQVLALPLGYLVSEFVYAIMLMAMSSRPRLLSAA